MVEHGNGYVFVETQGHDVYVCKDDYRSVKYIPGILPHSSQVKQNILLYWMHWTLGNINESA